jgi:subtilisin family serine protease
MPMKKQFTFRWMALLVAAFLLLSAMVPVALGAAPSLLDPRLLEELAASPGETSFLVFLSAQADLSAAATLPDRAARGQYVYDTLRAVAEGSQARLRADLDAWGVPYHPFFIVNALRVTGDEALARKLAARPEVARVVADPTFDGLDDPPPGPPGPAAVDAVEWNISRVNADDAWGLGYIGQNIVVGSCDTGVDWDHPALVNQYRGGAGNHDYNWYDAFYEYAEPTDPNGHGTHTVGTMVGNDGAANQIGMAPGAQWIACKVNSGSTWKASKYIECWEWFLAPTRVDGSDPDPSMAPHVINNSWSCPGSEGCDPDTLRDAAKALYAAGIAIAKSGGNSGSGCGTITVPGHYPELLATGAFDASDNIAGFSSRGPVTVDGGTRIKPDIAAPGVSIRSSVPGGGYGSLSGTSMAAPHTAGLIALLWSAQPALIGDLATTYEIVEASAEPTVDLQCPPNGPGGRPNNVWGWGIIDALAAVEAATDTGLGVLSGTVTDSSDGAPLPGADIEIVQAANGLSREIAADGSGTYSETLLAVSYDVTATLYGYLPATASTVVMSGTVTTLDLALDPAPVWSLSGSVVEQGSGMPLRATLNLLDAPVTTTTDPLTGGYAVDVSEGSYTLRASSPGYEPQERAITVQGDLTEDFALQPVVTYYVRDNTAPCGPTFDWIDITATGQAHNLADDANQYVSLGGPTFSFYGLDYNALYLGSNGFVTFGSGSNYPGGNTIPSGFPPNNAIYAFWDDLNPAYGSQGTIYTELVDGHLFVVEFYQVEHWPDGDPETFEIVLDLDTGAILLQYLQVSNTAWTSVGIENSDGTTGLSYAFHDPAVPADSLAVAFYPVTGAHPDEQGMGELEGTVAEAGTGEPIEGATVAAVTLTGGEVFSYTTGASGTYSDTLCADWYTMTATAAGYHPSQEVQATVVSGTLTIRDFELERTEADLWADGTGPITATAGAYLTYTLDLGSLGPDVAPYGEAALGLSPWVEYVSSSGGSYDEVEGWWTWGIPDVASGYSGTAMVVVQVTETVPVGEEVCSSGGFQADGAGAPLDPDEGNNTFEVCTVVEARLHLVYLPVVVKVRAP